MSFSRTTPSPAPGSQPPLVTIGMPTYQRPEGLRRALDCAQAQTHTRLEIIVSENGVADARGYSFMDAVAAADSRVRYVRQPRNLGALGNFRFVLEQARGKYFAWFADDDLCEPDFVSRLVDELEQDAACVVACCDLRVIDAHGQQTGMERLSELYTGAGWNRARRRFFQYPVSNVFYAIYGLYRTELLREAGGRYLAGWRGHNTNTEVPLLAWLATRGEIRALPVALKHYRIHEQSVYSREAQTLSRATALRIKLHIRRQLLSIVAGAELAWREKLDLLVSTLLPRPGRLLRKLAP